MHSARCTAHARKDWVQLPIFMTAWHCKISTARWRLENLVLPFLLIPSLLGRIVLHRKSFINHYSATIFMIHKMGSKYSFMIGWWIFWMHSAWHFSFAVIVSEKNPSDRMLTASISRLVIFLGTEGWGRGGGKGEGRRREGAQAGAGLAPAKGKAVASRDGGVGRSVGWQVAGRRAVRWRERSCVAASRLLRCVYVCVSVCARAHARLRALRVARAPPPPSRRQWRVSTEHTPCVRARVRACCGLLETCGARTDQAWLRRDARLRGASARVRGTVREVGVCFEP